MLEEFMNVILNEETDGAQEQLKAAEVKNLIDGLEMFDNDPKMLTNAYTDIFCNDNVVYLLTRISQHPIFMKHFPEFYEKNENGESVINCQQNSPYHRYGVFRHILYTMEYAGKDNLKYSKHELNILKWTMFLHDIGKPAVKTTNSEGKDSFAGHDDVSVQMAEEILNRFYFTDEDKKIILMLIKYHDRYLNEGELTYDNLCFLANELENKKELFELLIEVKTADNKAKSIEVYNKFTTVIPKYVDFANEYFSKFEPEETEEIITSNIVEDDFIVGFEQPLEELIVETKKEIKNSYEITEEIFNDIYQNLLSGTGVRVAYSPIINIEEGKLYGYESVVKLDGGYDIEEFIKKAKEYGKYDKVNQRLLIISLENGLKDKKDKEAKLIVKVDFESFKKYNNKIRVYDMLDKDNVAILFENYNSTNSKEIDKICKEINVRHGIVALNKFNESNKSLKDLMDMAVEIVLCDIDENTDFKDIIDYCESEGKIFAATGIDDKDSLTLLKKLKIKFAQGKKFIDECEVPQLTESEIESVVKKIKK